MPPIAPMTAPRPSTTTCSTAKVFATPLLGKPRARKIPISWARRGNGQQHVSDDAGQCQHHPRDGSDKQDRNQTNLDGPPREVGVGSCDRDHLGLQGEVAGDTSNCEVGVVGLDPQLIGGHQSGRGAAEAPTRRTVQQRVEGVEVDEDPALFAPVRHGRHFVDEPDDLAGQRLSPNREARAVTDVDGGNRGRLPIQQHVQVFRHGPHLRAPGGSGWSWRLADSTGSRCRRD